jgi:catechol 2,3-dioxygenase-like lactoylglutathione lyase family enzyme
MVMLHHVSIRTSNLEKLFNFYTTYFCEEIKHKFISSNGECYGYMLKFINGGIVELMSTENSKSTNSQQILYGFHHMCLAINDLENFLIKFPETYVLEPIKIGRTDFVKQIMLCDPDGNKIELHELS